VTEPFSRYERHPTPVGLTPAPDLPPEDHPAWAGLIQGLISHDFSYAAAGMLVFNLNLQWKRDPSKLPVLITQARSFFHKYQHLLGGDVQKLFS
jgi:hypothetical protein